MAKEKGMAVKEVVHELAFERHLKQLAREREGRNKNKKAPLLQQQGQKENIFTDNLT